MTALIRSIADHLLRLIHVPNHLSSEAYVDYARERGCTIGEGTRFFGEKKLDLSRAPLIEIGEGCVITDRVRILAHTWDRPILRRRFGDADAPGYESVQPVTVGDNVFIGENAMVLPGCEIGDNSIIGAGSVVASDVPAESVAVGNPCRVVASLDEYRQRRLDREIEDLHRYLARYDGTDVEADPAVRNLVGQEGPEP